MSNTPLVFIHGWGQDPDCWLLQRERYPDAHYLCLPGHAGAADAKAENWLDILHAQLPQQATSIIGWSLGGQLAMQLALKFPEQVNALLLIATTPCFCQQDDWPDACSATVFSAFQQGIMKNPKKTLRRFRALMLKGGPDPNREIGSATITPTTSGLFEGLHLLEHIDLRADLSHIKQPTWVVHGSNDAVTPVAAGGYLAELIPQAQWHRLEGANHVPQLTETAFIHSMIQRCLLTESS